MFKYIHGYHPATINAFIKSGLLREQDGLKLFQGKTLSPEMNFNVLAAKNSELYNIIKERRCPFYVDRLQGGTFIDDYEYDLNLVDEYLNLLGNDFLGFQMHEWISNYHTDLEKIIDNHCPDWTKHDIADTINKRYNTAFIYLESMTLDEITDFGKPESLSQFLSNLEYLYQKRQKQLKGLVFPCDSVSLSFPISLKCGSRFLMAEIGAQSPDTRVQVAFARGMAKAYGVPFGTYYEPWGGKPFSACLYKADGISEWGKLEEANFPFKTSGGNGGSSRSLQRRMHLYSFMAGADFMSEEWGMCNTFYDWKDFELTPYGKIKKDFLDFTDKYSDIGTPVIPIAFVLPKEFTVWEDTYSEIPYVSGFMNNGEYAEKLKKARAAAKKIFRDGTEMHGDEINSLRNCYTFDAVDIVTEDVIKTNDYKYLIDLTGNASFADKNKEKIIDEEEVLRILEKELPCTVSGGATKQLTRNEKGEYYLCLMNNQGITRSVSEGEKSLSDCAITVTVNIKNGRQLNCLEGGGKIKHFDGNNYFVAIPAGDFFFAKF